MLALGAVWSIVILCVVIYFVWRGRKQKRQPPDARGKKGGRVRKVRKRR